PFLLHHLYGKPSEIIVFGGPWLDRLRLVLRYRELPNDAGRQSQSENPR
ncbi:phage tail protein, partial [Pseudomonas aeruginosa]|nr:phage tail protein [Pseudomonas aeruginosa]MCO2739199.1 phage tail protein [Pseudomonas aeruginosa]